MLTAWDLAKRAEAVYWGATGSTLSWGAARYAYTKNPATLRLGWQMASLGARAHINAVRGILSTPLVRGSSPTIGSAAARAAGSIGAGYMVGAVMGTAISHAAFGDRGAELAIDLYKNPVNFYKKGILGAGENVRKIYQHYM